VWFLFNSPNFNSPNVIPNPIPNPNPNPIIGIRRIEIRRIERTPSVDLLVGRSVAIASCAQTAEQIHLKFEMLASVPNAHIAITGSVST